MTQFLPPISATTRLSWRAPGATSAAVRSNSRPTGPEPVKAIVATSGCCASAAPASPSPGSNAIAPAGTPPARSASTTRRPQPGACSAGFSTAVLPVASAAAAMPIGIASGKFHGAITAQTPRGA